jgi:lactate dehydrogenase-like 2-hydroxyacid dehydrogenase
MLDNILDERAPEIRGIVTMGERPIDRALIYRLPALAIIARYGAGYDEIDVEAATDKGIVVTNTPGVLDDDVADIAMALMLLTHRNLGLAMQVVQNGAWANGEMALSRFGLGGRRLGIIGMGRIGRAIAKRATAAGMLVRYHNRSPIPGTEWPYDASVEDLANNSDVLLAALPGGAATRHIVDRTVLRALGEDGIFINVARGSVVDTDDLIAALDHGEIFAAGLDVVEGEPDVDPRLLGRTNLVLLPHIGSATEPARHAMAQLAVDNIVAYFTEGRALTPIPTPGP